MIPAIDGDEEVGGQEPGELRWLSSAHRGSEGWISLRKEKIRIERLLKLQKHLKLLRQSLKHKPNSALEQSPQ